MMSYLSCIKKVKGVNEDECRMLAKSYLACRMDRWVIHGAHPHIVVTSSNQLTAGILATSWLGTTSRTWDSRTKIKEH